MQTWPLPYLNIPMCTHPCIMSPCSVTTTPIAYIFPQCSPALILIVSVPRVSSLIFPLLSNCCFLAVTLPSVLHIRTTCGSSVFSVPLTEYSWHSYCYLAGVPVVTQCTCCSSLVFLDFLLFISAVLWNSVNTNTRTDLLNIHVVHLCVHMSTAKLIST